MAMRMSLQFWTVFIIGLFYTSSLCDARAVNISNTWTMPQEGLNVFYRFFRDRISWFEADAVCQFHHANLVTVDNSFQFDATRDLLRELDVNDIVWIGLMRPQNSERFMWSNSRPLAADTGYWAESLPLMDAPLCAVIDPIRDYRWHALRCGGPETASFLCEMPVPSWADACIIKDMPALTMQYMADTASIELIRNCGEEGLLRQSCRTKEDRERVVSELICPKERYEAQRINDITSSHFKSLQIINSIPSDNKENNNIELLPLGNGAQIFPNTDFNEQVQTEKNTVQRLIEQFNVDELMQADQAQAAAASMPHVRLSGFNIPGEIPKPVKKMAKKVVRPEEYEKKQKMQKNFELQQQIQRQQQQQWQQQKQQQQQWQQQQQKLQHQSEQQQRQQMKPEAILMPVALPLEEMMMGDQPANEQHADKHRFEDNEASNEIMQPLPHLKKVLPQDLRKKLLTVKEEEEQEMQELHQVTAAVATTENSIVSSSTTTTTTTLAPATTITMISTTSTAAAVSSSSSSSSEEIITSAAAASTQGNVDSSTIISTTATASSNTAAAVTTAAFTTTTAQTATIGHPMHPQQQPQQRSSSSSVGISDELLHMHIKESTDNSHFIPPMLMVKSHYVPPAKHEQHEPQQAQQEKPHADYEQPKKFAVVEQLRQSTIKPTAAENSDTAATEVLATHAAADEKLTTVLPLTETTTNAPATAAETTESFTTRKTTTTLSTSTTTSTAMPTTTRTISAATYEDEYVSKSMLQKLLLEQKEKMQLLMMDQEKNKKSHATTTMASATSTKEATTTQAELVLPEKMLVHQSRQQQQQFAVATTATAGADKNITATATTTTAAAPLTTADAKLATITTAAFTTITTTTSEMDTKSETSTEVLTTDAPSSIATATTTVATAKHNTEAATTSSSTATATTTSEQPASPTPTHNFLNEETEVPYKPNRRRSLTKPETASYFKKILG